jgi:hypothetical protein
LSAARAAASASTASLGPPAADLAVRAIHDLGGDYFTNVTTSPNRQRQLIGQPQQIGLTVTVGPAAAQKATTTPKHVSGSARPC